MENLPIKDRISNVLNLKNVASIPDEELLLQLESKIIRDHVACYYFDGPIVEITPAVKANKDLLREFVKFSTQRIKSQNQPILTMGGYYILAKNRIIELEDKITEIEIEASKAKGLIFQLKNENKVFSKERIFKEESNLFDSLKPNGKLFLAALGIVVILFIFMNIEKVISGLPFFFSSFLNFVTYWILIVLIIMIPIVYVCFLIKSEIVKRISIRIVSDDFIMSFQIGKSEFNETDILPFIKNKLHHFKIFFLFQNHYWEIFKNIMIRDLQYKDLIELKSTIGMVRTFRIKATPSS